MQFTEKYQESYASQIATEKKPKKKKSGIYGGCRMRVINYIITYGYGNNFFVLFDSNKFSIV